MKKLRTCKNKCIFCFIDQLPGDLRSSLYLKDDDYIESYTHGNFITLTNLQKKDIENIIRFRIEPLHISVHSLDRNIRNFMFGNKKNYQAIKNLETLDRNGIRTNIQMVICPGINDGNDLIKTLSRLTTEYKKILSIGIVPVGITRYCRYVFLKPFDRKSSKRIITLIEDHKKNNASNKNCAKVYLSDEFYILAQTKFPDYKSYGRFLQIQNGIGKTVNFLKEVSDGLKKYIDAENVYDIIQNRILIVTSEYGKYVFREVLRLIKNQITEQILKKGRIYKAGNFIKVLAISNNFLGGNVKVAGLLSGNDIINALNSINLKKFKKVLIPDCIFNKDLLTIDGLSRYDIENFNCKIKIADEEGNYLIKELIK